MLFFGLGTSPALFLFSGTLGWLSHRARDRMLRAAGLLVAAMGLSTSASTLSSLVGTLSAP